MTTISWHRNGEEGRGRLVGKNSGSINVSKGERKKKGEETFTSSSCTSKFASFRFFGSLTGLLFSYFLLLSLLLLPFRSESFLIFEGLFVMWKEGLWMRIFPPLSFSLFLFPSLSPSLSYSFFLLFPFRNQVQTKERGTFLSLSLFLLNFSRYFFLPLRESFSKRGSKERKRKKGKSLSLFHP